jgi:Gas vesicle protein K
MASAEMGRRECEGLSACAPVMDAGTPAIGSEAGEGSQSRSGQLHFDVNGAKNGLGQLVLTLVKLLHELLERQAIRRVDAGSLTEQQTERLGLVLMQQAQEIERLRKEFGLEEEDLNLDLGPLGRLL